MFAGEFSRSNLCVHGYVCPDPCPGRGRVRADRLSHEVAARVLEKQSDGVYTRSRRLVQSMQTPSPACYSKLGGRAVGRSFRIFNK